MRSLDPSSLPRPASFERPGIYRARRRGVGLHLALFAATFLTAAMASAFHQGFDIISYPASIRAGLPFAITIMTILLFHECGHYFLARAHRVDASLPFFLPAPPFFLFGTFGAFIRMRTVPPHRRALFDIGAAGPWAGFVVAVPAVVFGLQISEVRPLSASEGGLVLGDSLLFSWLTRMVLGVQPDQATILLHPVALAGWFGLLVTCLNLLPVGQLDGGHVSYALFGRRHRWIARGVFTFVLVLGLGGWAGWFVWGALLLLLGLDHPPTWDPSTQLDRRRVLAAVMTFGVLALTFVPEPFTFVEPSRAPTFDGERIPVNAPAQLTHCSIESLIHSQPRPTSG
jgi:membrane-associated protease RseP (regulator of RpoE activity)